MSATITLARREDGKIIHINEFQKADKGLYSCAGCNEKVTGVKSELRKKDWHFRHAPSDDIDSCISKALHNLAVQLLMENESVIIGKNNRIRYCNPRKESSFFGRRSDVMVNYGGQDIHFEIFVTHDCEPEKIKVYKTNKIKSVLIDLSNPSLKTADRKTVEDLVLADYTNKRIIYWEDEKEPVIENNPSFSWQKVLLFIGLLVGAYYAIKKLFSFSGRR
jgi:hypothetical protein